MLKFRSVAVTALALILGLMMIAPSASAVVDGLGYIYLTTDGGDDLVGTDWKVYVETPPAVGLDADYWNFTVYAVPLNASATNATFYVNIYIYDGATNVTENCTIEAKNDVTVYSNASFEAADYAAVVANTSGVTYVDLLDDGFVTLDSYSSGISIYENEYYATIIILLYAMIPILIIMMVFSYLKIGGKGGLGSK